jgi:hypothetical protein
MMDPAYGKKTCYIQFPQRFDGIDLHDRYANRNIVFFDVSQSIYHQSRKYSFLCNVVLDGSCFVIISCRST